MNNTWHYIIDCICSLYPVPVPLLDVAEDEGICVIFDDYGKDTFDGMTWYEPSQNKFYIHINTGKGNGPSNKKGRFTLAHELGHYFIEHHRQALESGKMQPHIHLYDPFGKNEAWEIEREADGFAASLLMPTNCFFHDVEDCPFSGQLIESLASKYNVSFSSCALRYLDMNLVPIMLVYAEDGMIRWQMKSRNFPFCRMRYGIGAVPENTVMGDYFHRHDDSCCRQSEIVFAKDCFHTYEEEQNDIRFYEYCIPFKRTAFSIFWQMD